MRATVPTWRLPALPRSVGAAGALAAWLAWPTVAAAAPESVSSSGLWVGEMVAAALVGVGLALWLAGHRVLRPMFALVGLCLGAVGGMAAMSWIEMEEIASVPTPMVGLVLGAIVGVLLSVAMFRAAMAVGSAAVLGLAAAIAAVMVAAAPDAHSPVLASLRTELAERATRDGTVRGPSLLLDGVAVGTEAPDVERRDAREGSDVTTTMPAGGAEQPDAAGVSERDRIRRASSEALATARDVGRAAWREAELRWAQLDLRQQRAIALGGVGGAFLGLLLGLAMPGRLAMLTTAVIGSALWIPAGIVLGARWEWQPAIALMDQPVQRMLMVWLAATAFGLLAQWLIRRRPARASARGEGGEE